jgi:hypothetical protein
VTNEDLADDQHRGERDQEREQRQSHRLGSDGVLDHRRLLVQVDHEELTPGLGVQGHEGLDGAPEARHGDTVVQPDERCVEGVGVEAQPAEQRRRHEQRLLRRQGGDRDHVVAGHGDAHDTNGQRGGAGGVDASRTRCTGQQIQHAAHVQVEVFGKGAVCHHLICAGRVEHPALGDLGSFDGSAETGVDGGLQEDLPVAALGSRGGNADGRGHHVDPGEPGDSGVEPRHPAQVLAAPRTAHRELGVGTP